MLDEVRDVTSEQHSIGASSAEKGASAVKRSIADAAAVELAPSALSRPGAELVDVALLTQLVAVSATAATSGVHCAVPTTAKTLCPPRRLTAIAAIALVRRAVRRHRQQIAAGAEHR